ncbi:transmembrane protein 107-like [Mercenaria mercenaria]|uniref:transmembrane protein 107-like n=1 Tax=Mercenaria mercenaria TaxID=6596 RepID=UPI00234F28B0|nr:transmembrane protein 107-like [Mercenaria mercenaria]
MKVTGIVPARFLTIVSHLVLVLVIFWSRRPNIESCLPSTYTQADYDKKDLQGSPVYSFQCLLSISAHCGASVALSYYLWREWPCERFWYIFGFCNAAPGFTKIFTWALVGLGFGAYYIIALINNVLNLGPKPLY